MSKGRLPPEAALLARARKAARVSQVDAAHGAGVSRAWVQAIEAGTGRGSAQAIAALAAFYGVTTAQLAREGDRPDAADVLGQMRRTPDNLADRIAELNPELRDAVNEFLNKVFTTARNGRHRAS
jgi:transcriptional regulator with XRE-family HTH domain